MRLAALAATLAGTTLVLDFVTPLGIAGGVPHIAAVALTLGLRARWSTAAAATIVSVLVLLGAVLSPARGDVVVVIANRTYALVIIWVVAILIMIRKRADDEIADRERRVIKLDQSLVHGVDTDPGRQQDLRRVLGVCRSLSARVVAGGVETAGEHAFLRDLGIEAGQSYLWGRPAAGPVPASDLPPR